MFSYVSLPQTNTKYLRTVIVELSFLLITSDIVLIKECTLFDIKYGGSRTFHVKCGRKTFQKIRQRFSEQLKYNRACFNIANHDYGNYSYKQFCEILQSVVRNFELVLTKGNQ